MICMRSPLKNVSVALPQCGCELQRSGRPVPALAAGGRAGLLHGTQRLGCGGFSCWVKLQTLHTAEMRHLAVDRQHSASPLGSPSVFPDLTQPRDKAWDLLFAVKPMLSQKVPHRHQGSASVFLNGWSLRSPIPVKEENLIYAARSLKFF